MGKNIWWAAVALVLLAGLTGCRVKRTLALSSYTPSPTEYIHTDNGGSVSLRAYGFGPDEAGAVDQAYRNAFEEILFSGVRSDRGGELARPLVNAPNAKERYAGFFDTFFAQKVYMDFVAVGTDEAAAVKTEKNALHVKAGISFGVKYAELKRYLRENNIK